jgi:hypothetical protein
MPVKRKCPTSSVVVVARSTRRRSTTIESTTVAPESGFLRIVLVSVPSMVAVAWEEAAHRVTQRASVARANRTVRMEVVRSVTGFPRPTPPRRVRGVGAA